ncbi:unnamed protein product [Heterobilharzia americana]|nr:unnamed protein product [Heterobilharzia americana]CAH8496021.1 unnamed protein product [Heterobilharzia americana]CAH8511445.1 unnamed protein product [Heterobilharzia americana]
MSGSRARQNFAKECEDAINAQINMELKAAYDYMAFFTYFDRDDVAFPKAAEFFRKASHEEREHAEKLAKYLNKRGGRVVYSDVKSPSKTEFTGLEDAMNTALEMEKAVNESLLKLHDVATAYNDPALTDFIEGEFLHEQEEAIKQFADYVTQTKRVGSGLGEYLFDKLTLSD